MAKAKSDRITMTTHEVRVALRERYAPPAWALFEEVGNSTGIKSSRWADAIAMGLWHSRGIDIHGFEIKASRSDVIREMRDPSKAETVAQHCDFWWLVVGDAAIVKDGELPETWGLLVPCEKGGLSLVQKPKRLREVHTMHRDFVASILRRAHEQWSSHALRQQIHREIYAEVTADAKSDVERDHDRKTTCMQQSIDHLQRQLDEARDQLRAVQGSEYSPAQIAGAVKLIRILSGWQSPANSARTIINGAAHIESLAVKIRELMTESEVIIKELSP